MLGMRGLGVDFCRLDEYRDEGDRFKAVLVNGATIGRVLLGTCIVRIEVMLF